MTFFEPHDLCDYREGETGVHVIENVWENYKFIMSYLMAYMRYPFKTCMERLLETLTPTI